MSEGDILSLLSESAARVHGLARQGLGLGSLPVLDLRQPWRAVAARFLDQPDGDFTSQDLASMAAVHFALVAGLPSDDAVFNEEALPAWEAVARHLCQWVNELEEGSLRGLEASEAVWQDWARQRGLRGIPQGV